MDIRKHLDLPFKCYTALWSILNPTSYLALNSLFTLSEHLFPFLFDSRRMSNLFSSLITITVASKINHCITQGSTALYTHIRHIATYIAIYLVIVPFYSEEIEDEERH